GGIAVRDEPRRQSRDAAPGRARLLGGRPQQAAGEGGCAMTGRQELLSETKAALDTPALLVDLDVMAGNIARIARTCREHGVRWRPHTKGQKTPEIIRMELAAGARGITCAKLGEAEA